MRCIVDLPAFELIFDLPFIFIFAITLSSPIGSDVQSSTTASAPAPSKGIDMVAYFSFALGIREQIGSLRYMITYSNRRRTVN